jgi:flagellar motor switch protein FliG
MKRLSKDQKQQRADLVTRLNDAAEAVRAALAAVNAEIAGKLNSLSQTRGARGGKL